MECNETEDGGGRGIRTPDDREAITDFKSAGFNHSPIPPEGNHFGLVFGKVSSHFAFLMFRMQGLPEDMDGFF